MPAQPERCHSGKVTRWECLYIWCLCLEKKKEEFLFLFLINFMQSQQLLPLCVTTLTSVRNGNLTLCHGLVHTERHMHINTHTHTEWQGQLWIGASRKGGEEMMEGQSLL